MNYGNALSKIGKGDDEECLTFLSGSSTEEPIAVAYYSERITMPSYGVKNCGSEDRAIPKGTALNLGQ